MSTSQAAEVHARYMELLDGREIEPEEFYRFFAEDIDGRELPTPAFPEGRAWDLATLRALIGPGMGVFPRRRAHLHEVIADGDRAAVRYSWEAEAAFDAGRYRRGETVRYEMARFVAVANGKITRAYEYLSFPPDGWVAPAESPPPAPVQGEPSAEEVARRYIELYNDGTPESYGSDRFLDFFAEDADIRVMPYPYAPRGQVFTPASMRPILAKLPMRNRRLAVRETIASGNRVALRELWEAEVGVDGNSLGPRGTTLRAETAEFVTVADGKVTRLRQYNAVLLPSPPGRPAR